MKITRAQALPWGRIVIVAGIGLLGLGLVTNQSWFIVLGLVVVAVGAVIFYSGRPLD